MKYMGSKSKIANDIINTIKNHCDDNNFIIKTWIEPFVGGSNIIKNISDDIIKIGYDNNKYLIEMYKSLQLNGINYFTHNIPKELYDSVRECYKNKNNMYENDYIGWIGFMASANGRFFDGGYSGISYTKIGTKRNYIDESIRGLEKELESLKNVKYNYNTYENLNFKNSLIYCDPPYKNTKVYNTSKNFNYNNFYDWCINQNNNGNMIFISEYDMPSDFECIWKKDHTSSLRANNKISGAKNSVEKLFVIK